MFESRVVSKVGSGKNAVRMMLVGLLVAGAAVVGQSASAEGHGRHGMGGGMGGAMSERMLDGLNATDAQKVRIKQIMQAASEEMKGPREAARALRAKSLEIFTAPVVNAAAAEEVRKQMVAQHDMRSKVMLRAMLDASRELTPEQRAQLGERMKERSARMQERMQRHHGDGARK